jgi:hypothetical protein
MFGNLAVGLVGLVLLLVLLVPAERALLNVTRRRLDRRRRVPRALLFLVGVASWGYVSYAPLYGSAGRWWFISFLVVAGVWKLVVDVLIFGVPDRADSAKPPRDGSSESR